jgi:hypothetical protein
MNQLTNQTSIHDTDYIPEAPTNLTAEGTERGEFDMELTVGAVYDSLQERLALARTRALMGERAPALDLLRQARADYETYKDALQGFPLYALEHAFTVTMQTLCADKRIEREEETPLALTSSKALSEPAERGVERKARSRKRATKAA